MQISNEDFDAMLETVAKEHTVSALLTIPGIYEILSEHFNNEVIERIEKGQETEENENQ